MRTDRQTDTKFISYCGVFAILFSKAPEKDDVCCRQIYLNFPAFQLKFGPCTTLSLLPMKFAFRGRSFMP